jgi:hypothetical protein
MDNKKITLMFVVVGALCLFLGYASGRGYKTYEINMAEKRADEAKMQAEMKMDHMDMQHDHVEVFPGWRVPKVELSGKNDSMGGFNLNIRAFSFWFTPEDIGGAPTPNRGHAHVYVNNVKIGRAYGPWYYISADKLKNGTNTVSVVLNANNHAEWTDKNGNNISASIQVVK